MRFIKQHKGLTSLFVVCMILMIKNSSIPYFFDPPEFVQLIFNKPTDEFSSGLAQIVDVFASAYVTSLMFYYMVDYWPTKKQEKKAKEVLAPKLTSLYLYTSELLALIEYSAKKEGLMSNGKIEEMDKLVFRNDKKIFCNKTMYKNENENGTSPYLYELVKDCDRFRMQILDVCSAISSSPSISYCDTQMIHLITQIQLAELLQVLPKPDSFILQLDSFDSTINELGKKYCQLKSIFDELASFVETRLACSMNDISVEEIESWRHYNQEILKQYPQLAQILGKVE